MSKWIRCPECGLDKEVPAFAGDGVYSVHFCPVPPTEALPIPSTDTPQEKK